MLKKLMKYEFRATGRTMLPLYGILLIMAFFSHFSMKFLSTNQEFNFFSLINVLLVTVYFLLIFAVGFMTILLMAQRFYRNLLGDEGYLMFTLPSSVPQNIFSKLIVSVVWFFASTLVSILAIAILTFHIDYIRQIVQAFQGIFTNFTPYNGMQGFLICVELLLLAVACMGSSILIVYASIAVGHRFATHRVAFSFLAFIVFTILSQTVGYFMIWLLSQFGGWIHIASRINSLPSFHLALLSTILVFALYGAVFYFITRETLRKHLNLD